MRSMKPILFALGLASATVLSAAADGVQPPPAPAPVKPSITFPVAPTPPPAPAPAPAPSPSPVLPNAVQTLEDDVLHVATSDEPFLQFASPADLVTITRVAGPLTIYAKFLDSKGEYEERRIDAKHIAITKSVKGKSGRVELIAVPVGAADESKAVRQRIDVNQGAKPPPDKLPDPKPVPPDADPKPDPKPIVTGDLWVIVVEELDDRTVATAKIVNDSAFWLDQAKRGVKMRTYDKDEAIAVSKGYVREAGKVGLPAVLLLDADGDVVRAKAMPKDMAGMKAIIAEVRP